MQTNAVQVNARNCPTDVPVLSALMVIIPMGLGDLIVSQAGSFLHLAIAVMLSKASKTKFQWYT